MQNANSTDETSSIAKTIAAHRQATLEAAEKRYRDLVEVAAQLSTGDDLSALPGDPAQWTRTLSEAGKGLDDFEAAVAEIRSLDRLRSEAEKLPEITAAIVEFERSIREGEAHAAEANGRLVRIRAEAGDMLARLRGKQADGLRSRAAFFTLLDKSAGPLTEIDEKIRALNAQRSKLFMALQPPKYDYRLDPLLAPLRSELARMEDKGGGPEFPGELANKKEELAAAESRLKTQYSEAIVAIDDELPKLAIAKLEIETRLLQGLQAEPA
ncbi:MAG TPA: hypothetical protein VFE24_00810 [Pirellulales bacterium]|jgi:hypothetical protein|nr:hypothetical protein [Pirellulales bacterium]